jgi:hypothetical protein
MIDFQETRLRQKSEAGFDFWMSGQSTCGEMRNNHIIHIMETYSQRIVERSGAMSVRSLSVSSGNSDGMKVIHFFKIVGILGGLVWLTRVLIGIAVFVGILLSLGLLS